MEPNRSISTRRLIAGLVAQAPLALKNFRLYFTNLYRRKILRTNIVAPYALIFYATHKCNLACSSRRMPASTRQGTAKDAQREIRRKMPWPGHIAVRS
jgi:hypothetical protein